MMYTVSAKPCAMLNLVMVCVSSWYFVLYCVSKTMTRYIL